eukprot:2721465-Rhodomonas_salina.1
MAGGGRVREGEGHGQRGAPLPRTAPVAPGLAIALAPSLADCCLRKDSGIKADGAQDLKWLCCLSKDAVIDTDSEARCCVSAARVQHRARDALVHRRLRDRQVLHAQRRNPLRHRVHDHRQGQPGPCFPPGRFPSDPGADGVCCDARFLRFLAQTQTLSCSVLTARGVCLQEARQLAESHDLMDAFALFLGTEGTQGEYVSMAQVGFPFLRDLVWRLDVWPTFMRRQVARVEADLTFWCGGRSAVLREQAAV